MRVTVVGTGYVGLVTGTCFAGRNTNDQRTMNENGLTYISIRRPEVRHG